MKVGIRNILLYVMCTSFTQITDRCVTYPQKKKVSHLKLESNIDFAFKVSVVWSKTSVYNLCFIILIYLMK